MVGVGLPLTTRVALRHQVARVLPVSRKERKPHYVRLDISIDLPSRDPYLLKIQGLAARQTGTIPIIKRVSPVEVTLDLPISLEERQKVIDAVQRLPFVRRVLITTGPPIR